MPPRAKPGAFCLHVPGRRCRGRPCHRCAIVSASSRHRPRVSNSQGKSWSGFGYRSFVFGGRPIAVAGNVGDKYHEAFVDGRRARARRRRTGNGGRSAAAGTAAAGAGNLREGPAPGVQLDRHLRRHQRRLRLRQQQLQRTRLYPRTDRQLQHQRLPRRRHARRQLPVGPVRARHRRRWRLDEPERHHLHQLWVRLHNPERLARHGARPRRLCLRPHPVLRHRRWRVRQSASQFRRPAL